jgi:hypothetical protein
MATRGRFFRSRDRASHKPSEVVGIFILGIIGGMIVSGVAVAIDYILRQVFGIG